MSDQTIFVVRESYLGPAVGRGFHLSRECPTIKDAYVEEINDREAQLLGLGVCKVCHKRVNGGPAIDVLEGFFGEDWPLELPPDHSASNPRDWAWKLHDYLRDHNGYIAFRKPKDGASSPS